MSTLSQSYIFNMFNVNKAMTLKLTEAFKTGIQLDADCIQEQILQIKRTRISPLSEYVLSAFETGKIILVYSKTVRIPKAIPFVVLKIGGENRGVVFVNSHGSLVENEAVKGGRILNIQMKDLYVLMEGAFIACSYYDYPARLERSISLMKFCTSIYTQMVLRILNKDVSLSTDIELYNQVSFCISRFFLEKVWGNNNHNLVFGYAMGAISSPTNRTTLMIIDDQYTNANIETVNDLFKFLSTISPRLENMNTRYFVEYYINTYNDVAILGIDVLPYFLFSLTTSYCGCFMVNQAIINDIIKTNKTANVFYSELAKIL